MNLLPTTRVAVPAEIPPDADCLAVGEAPGKNEDLLRRPFIGASGQLLRGIAAQAGLKPAYCNVLPWHPKDNKLPEFCVKRQEFAALEPPDWLTVLPAIQPGWFLHPDLAIPAIQMLKDTIEQVKPKVILALGNTACWALLGETGIEKLAGTVHRSKLVEGYKVVPTYHPAAILRNWKNLPLFTLDLMKAKIESEFGEIILPPRWANIEPTLEDVEEFLSRSFDDVVSVDVETQRTPGPFLTMCGFALSPREALVIPFEDPTKPDRCYWTRDDHIRVQKLINWFLARKDVPKLFHNSLYDLQWLYSLGARPQNAYHDTLLMSHALWPEMPKSLRVLGRLFTRERSWKHIRRTTKRED